MEGCKSGSGEGHGAVGVEERQWWGVMSSKVGLVFATGNTVLSLEDANSLTAPTVTGEESQPCRTTRR